MALSRTDNQNNLFMFDRFSGSTDNLPQKFCQSLFSNYICHPPGFSSNWVGGEVCPFSSKVVHLFCLLFISSNSTIPLSDFALVTKYIYFCSQNENVKMLYNWVAQLNKLCRCWFHKWCWVSSARSSCWVSLPQFISAIYFFRWSMHRSPYKRERSSSWVTN